MDEEIERMIKEILWKLDTALEYYTLYMETKEANGQLNTKKYLSEEEIAENNEWRLLEEETVEFEGENDWEWRHKSL